MLLDEDEVETINGINTLSEMSSGEYCTPEGRSPDVGNIECCNGLKKYEETGLCETCKFQNDSDNVIETALPLGIPHGTMDFWYRVAVTLTHPL